MHRRKIMVKKSRIALIAAVAALSFASPALAQSFNPDFGTGNELPSQYHDSGRLVRGNVAQSHEKIAMRHNGRDLFAMVR
jgi:hypothetical protein